MKTIFFTVYLVLTGLMVPVGRVFPASPEKTKELLKKYPKTGIGKRSVNRCPEVFLLDSCFYFNWSAGDSAWIPQQGSFYRYDEKGQLQEEEIKSPDGGSWSSRRKRVLFYDSRDKPVKQLYLSYDSDTHVWDTVNQSLYRYSAAGSLLETIVQVYDNGSWKDNIRYSNDYNDSGQKTCYLVSKRDPADTGWVPQYRHLYSWEGSLQSGYVKQVYDTASGSWHNDYKVEYSYNPQELLASQNLSDWDDSAGTWIEQSLIGFSYDDNGRITLKLYQTWQTDHWSNTARYLYTRERPDTTDILFQVWNATDSAWHDNYRFIYSFDACGNLISETGQVLDNGLWINDYRVENHVSPLQGGIPLSVEIVDSGNVSCYGRHDGWALAEASGGTPPYSWLWDNDPPSTDSLATGLAAWRWYHVTVTDAAGNTAVDSVMLSEPHQVKTGKICGPTHVCLHKYYRYHVKPYQSGTYHWTAYGGNLIGHPTGSYAFVKWTRPGSDTLTVVFINRNGCPGDTAVLVVNTLTVSAQSPEENNIRIWPNPASDLLNIFIPEDKPFTYTLTDLSGRVLITGTGRGGSGIVIPVSALSPDIYILQLSSEGLRIIRKIVIR
jgi:hypothetical protein